MFLKPVASVCGVKIKCWSHSFSIILHIITLMYHEEFAAIAPVFFNFVIIGLSTKVPYKWAVLKISSYIIILNY